jgi:HEAT repeat protein/PBS lyase HEAT-like repeat-containing protein
MNRSVWVTLAAVVAAAAAAVILWLVPRQRSREAAIEEVAPQAGPARSSGEVQERLQQLGEARDRATRSGADGRISAATGPANRKMGPPGGAPAARDQPAQDAGESGGRPATMPEFIDPQPEDIPTLKGMALNDADPQRRLAAVTLLGASDDPEVIPVLAKALSDQDEDVRMAAVQSLADFTGEAPVDAIEGALNDPSADVRYEALEVLSDIGGDRARRAVQHALNDPDEDVQELAQSILEFDLDEDESQ